MRICIMKDNDLVCYARPLKRKLLWLHIGYAYASYDMNTYNDRSPAHWRARSILYSYTD